MSVTIAPATDVALEKKETKALKAPLDLPTEEEMKMPTWGRLRPEVKMKWLKLLRGELKYSKTKSRLKKEDSYCIWGTLCELHRRETGGEWVYYAHQWSYEGSGGCPPQAVVEWAGFHDMDVPLRRHGPGGSKMHLMMWNDNTDMQFDEFADLIEEQL